jgi:hypothetical protein
MMHTTKPLTDSVHHEPVQDTWYKYGVALLVIEVALAIGVSCYSLYMTFHGIGGFPGKY